jgi:hypothetical protein
VTHRQQQRGPGLQAAPLRWQASVLQVSVLQQSSLLALALLLLRASVVQQPQPVSGRRHGQP